MAAPVYDRWGNVVAAVSLAMPWYRFERDERSSSARCGRPPTRSPRACPRPRRARRPRGASPGGGMSSLAPESVDCDVFRNVIGHFASGVTVITSRGDDKDHGMTASAVTSLSMDPPMLLVCINDRNPTAHAVSASGAFAVNILAESQADLAEQFGRPGDDKFSRRRQALRLSRRARAGRGARPPRVPRGGGGARRHPPRVPLARRPRGRARRRPADVLPRRVRALPAGAGRGALRGPARAGPEPRHGDRRTPRPRRPRRAAERRPGRRSTTRSPGSRRKGSSSGAPTATTRSCRWTPTRSRGPPTRAW